MSFCDCKKAAIQNGAPTNDLRWGKISQGFSQKNSEKLQKRIGFSTTEKPVYFDVNSISLIDYTVLEMSYIEDYLLPFPFKLVFKSDMVLLLV